MKIIYGLNNLKEQTKPVAVSVGIFDGLHIGHQLIIKELLLKAKQHKAEPAVITFDPHPLKVLKHKEAVSMLSSLDHRLSLLKELGVKLCIVIKFNKRFANYSAIDFIQKILVKKLKIKILVAGEDFSFGKDTLRTPEALERVAEDMSFKLSVVSLKKTKNRVISSSAIRLLIENGDLKTASKLLARPVSILGTVIKGKRRGRKLGFRTANIDPHHEAIPPSGVYAVYAKLKNNRYKAVLNIGKRPTFNEEDPSIEVHIFGTRRNLYGKDLEISFNKKLRPEIRFNDEESLSEQIKKDTVKAQRIL